MNISKALIALSLGFALAACTNQDQAADSAAEAAERATDAAIAAIGPNQPKAALFFDCVATRLRCGDHFQAEVDAVTSRVGDAALAGCNTHGQIARAEGQFEGFHNCTAVVCVFPG